jgi:TetR/AcrR family transcriptional regulator
MNNNHFNIDEPGSTVTERDAAGHVEVSAAGDEIQGHEPSAGAPAVVTRGEQVGHHEPEDDREDLEEEAPRRPTRKRPKPGERRLQILQTLAEMLETPKGDRITTAALAAKLKVSEAALYRHFASKAQMFEGLIEFIESTLFGLINQITTHEEDGFKQLRQILTMLLSFAERNPGMTRVIIGDALVTEDDRLQARINQLIDRLELSIKQSFRTAVAQGRLPQETDPGARANLLLSYVQGRWLRFAKGGFKRSPMEGLDGQVLLLIM